MIYIRLWTRTSSEKIFIHTLLPFFLDLNQSPWVARAKRLGEKKGGGERNVEKIDSIPLSASALARVR